MFKEEELRAVTSVAQGMVDGLFPSISGWGFTEFFKIFTLGGAHSQFSLGDLIQDCLYVHCCILLILCASLWTVVKTSSVTLK